MSARRASGVGPDTTPDFFVCDIFGWMPKDDLASMEHPMFSLATRPDRRILRYAHNDIRITVTPSVRGLATIHDKDILIYCISQLMAALNAGRGVARTLRLTARDLLVATGRETSGDAYRRLCDAFERLAGTRVTTNIATGPKDDPLETTTGFGLIESWQIVRKTRTGRMVSVSVTLSDWLYRSVTGGAVLTLSRDYFTLRKPLERRVYELARKHCGRQPDWRVGVGVLARKSGSASPVRVFRKMIRDMIAADPLPGYVLHEEPGDIIRVTRRRAGAPEMTDAPGQSVPGQAPAGRGVPGQGPALGAATIEAARETIAASAPGADVYALEAEWRDFWEDSGRVALRDPDRAFLAWLEGRLRRRLGGDRQHPAPARPKG